MEIEMKLFEEEKNQEVEIEQGDEDLGEKEMRGGIIRIEKKGEVKVIGGEMIEEKGVVGEIIME